MRKENLNVSVAAVPGAAAVDGVPHPCGFQGAGFDFNSGLLPPTPSSLATSPIL
jgi:hypothetical protein